MKPHTFREQKYHYAYRTVFVQPLKITSESIAFKPHIGSFFQNEVNLANYSVLLAEPHQKRLLV